MPVVYIDVLFTVNLFINCVMLRAAGALGRVRGRQARILIGGAVGALYAAAAFFPEMSLFNSLIFKLLASMLMVAAAFPVYGILEFFKLLGLFYAVNAAFGGLSFALLFLTGRGARPAAVYSNGIMYLDIPMAALLFGAAAFYGLLSLASGLRRLGQRRGIKRKVVVELGGKTAVLTALADTGNILVDPISRAPVIVAELEALKELFDYSTRVSLCSGSLQDGLGLMAKNGFKARLIPFSSVGEGEGMMVGFVPDRAAVRRGGGLRPMESCVIGIYPRRLSPDNSYDALYNPN